MLRAKVTLLAADGKANEQIAAELGCSKPTVLQWRDRFRCAGLDGLSEAGGRGRKPTYAPGIVERVVSTTLGPPPKGMTHLEQPAGGAPHRRELQHGATDLA